MSFSFQSALNMNHNHKTSRTSLARTARTARKSNPSLFRMCTNLNCKTNTNGFCHTVSCVDVCVAEVVTACGIFRGGSAKFRSTNGSSRASVHCRARGILRRPSCNRSDQQASEKDARSSHCLIRKEAPGRGIQGNCGHHLQG